MENDGISGAYEVVIEAEITLQDVITRLDSIGKQMDWLCENLAELFQFVSQIGGNGGGIRGLMSLMKQGPPQLTQLQGDDENAG